MAKRMQIWCDKAADNQMKCELIADKYKKLTGKDIKEDLENE